MNLNDLPTDIKNQIFLVLVTLTSFPPLSCVCKCWKDILITLQPKFQFYAGEQDFGCCNWNILWHNQKLSNFFPNCQFSWSLFPSNPSFDLQGILTKIRRENEQALFYPSGIYFNALGLFSFFTALESNWINLSKTRSLNFFPDKNEDFQTMCEAIISRDPELLDQFSAIETITLHTGPVVLDQFGMLCISHFFDCMRVFFPRFSRFAIIHSAEISVTEMNTVQQCKLQPLAAFENLKRLILDIPLPLEQLCLLSKLEIFSYSRDLCFCCLHHEKKEKTLVMQFLKDLKVAVCSFCLLKHRRVS